MATASLWNRSGTIERYSDDIRAAGAKAYFFNGGTTSPISVYQDSSSGVAHPHPVVADARGRWPDVFIPYSGTGYDVQVKTAENVQLSYTQNVPNPNPISVAAPPAVDGVTTGMIHMEMINGTKAGYVRLNARTIGDNLSGGSERANLDCQSLFVYLWNNVPDAVAPVSGGRTTALGDWGLHKTIQLPDWRGVGAFGLDDMGNASANRFTAQTFGSGQNSTTAGSGCGGNSKSITISNMPAHTHTATIAGVAAHTHGGLTGDESGHTHTGLTAAENQNHDHSATSGVQSPVNHTHSLAISVQSISVSAGPSQFYAVSGSPSSLTTGNQSANHTHSIAIGSENQAHTHNFITNAGSAHSHSISADGAHTHSITIDQTGSSAPLDGMPGARLVTWYIKL